jgi:hypothetical protein
LSKKESIKAMPPNTQSEQLYFLQNKRIAVRDFRVKETFKTEGRKPLLDAFQLVGIS